MVTAKGASGQPPWRSPRRLPKLTRLGCHVCNHERIPPLATCGGGCCDGRAEVEVERSTASSALAEPIAKQLAATVLFPGGSAFLTCVACFSPSLSSFAGFGAQIGGATLACPGHARDASRCHLWRPCFLGPRNQQGLCTTLKKFVPVMRKLREAHHRWWRPS